MKVAFIREKYCSAGPWKSLNWSEATLKQILDNWYSKTSMLGLISLLNADFYIIDDPIYEGVSEFYKNIRDCVTPEHSKYKEIMDKHSNNIFSSSQIPYHDYDIVITGDPILTIKNNSQTLFAYYVNEHVDTIYLQSLKSVLNGYDLFLDHMLYVSENLETLPQSISFPYLYDKETMMSVVSSEEKTEVVWVDWRTLCTLGMVKRWNENAERAALRLERTLNYPIKYKGSFGEKFLGISDPPEKILEYLKPLANCKYYISIGRDSGTGQSICDAASLRCICFGEKNKIYHRLISHPACLCESMFDLPHKFKNVVNNKIMHKEILAWQEKALQMKFADEPINLLQKAVEMKRNN